MSTNMVLNVAALAAVTALVGAPHAAWGVITVPTSPVGNAGNAADTTPNGPYGSVGYQYRVGTTEVTNGQYAAFLSAVGATDTQSLYNTGMAGSYGGITRAGVSGSYSYATIPGRENYPVNFVSFWDAARFANWLHNGQPTGPQNASTTEDGAYTLTPAGVAANSVTRNTGWQWAVTSSNEWYKAAYHQPAAQGGDADNYWMYPTSSNTAPTGFEANYLHSPPVPLPLNDIMPVASYGANYYGAHDMGGNVYEWSDSILAPPVRGPLWGGAFDNVAGWLTPANAYTPPPFTEREQVGFRIVQVPGPTAALVIGVVAGLGGARRRRLARTI